MIEVLWHGRGGQGAFTAARLLGAAAVEAGLSALAFPSFGPERRGAPMRAFTKLARGPIGDRSACAQADYVVYLDDTLLGSGWESQLKPGGRVLVNSTRRYEDPRVLAFDADGLSAAVLGRPIPNTALLGALARLEPSVMLEHIEAAVRSSMAPRLHGPNCAVAQQAHDLVEGLMTEGEGDWRAPAEAAAEAAGAASAGANGAMGADGLTIGGAAAWPAAADVVRPEARIPRLRSQIDHPDSLDPADYAKTTCFTAGHLVTKNAGWRSKRPVVDEGACTACGQCVQYCPDGAIYPGCADATAGMACRLPVVVDLDFCKGCGICATLCRFGAIAMVPEAQSAATPESEVAA